MLTAVLIRKAGFQTFKLSNYRHICDLTIYQNFAKQMLLKTKLPLYVQPTQRGLELSTYPNQTDYLTEKKMKRIKDKEKISTFSTRLK